MKNYKNITLKIDIFYNDNCKLPRTNFFKEIEDHYGGKPD